MNPLPSLPTLILLHCPDPQAIRSRYEIQIPHKNILEYNDFKEFRSQLAHFNTQGFHAQWLDLKGRLNRSKNTLKVHRMRVTFN